MRWEPKPISEIERAFIEGYERLVRAGGAYDAGHLSEAPDVAKEVMTFVYDHGGINSILTHLGAKETLTFVDSSKPRSMDGLPPGARLVSNE